MTTQVPADNSATSAPAPTATSEPSHNGPEFIYSYYSAPEEDVKCALPVEEHSHLADPKTGEAVDKIAPKASEDHRHFLVALDRSNPVQSRRTLDVTKQLTHEGDVVILLSAMSPIIDVDPAASSIAYSMGYGPSFDDFLAPAYSLDYEIDQLRKLKANRILELTKLSKEFPDSVKTFVHVVHGFPTTKILQMAEKHKCDIIVMGKRKLGRFEKLITSSVSNYIVAHADCTVVVAK